MCPSIHESTKEEVEDKKRRRQRYRRNCAFRFAGYLC